MLPLPCRHVLYPYETRILFLLLSDDQLDNAREIGRLLRQTDIAVDGVFTAPEAHQLGREFWHSLMPDELAKVDDVIDTNIHDEQVVGMLEEKARFQRSDACEELIRLIPAQIKSCSGCHTYALAPGRAQRVREPAAAAGKRPPHVAEYIIDQRSGQTQLHWLM